MEFVPAPVRTFFKAALEGNKCAATGHDSVSAGDPAVIAEELERDFTLLTMDARFEPGYDSPRARGVAFKKVRIALALALGFVGIAVGILV